MIDVKAAWKNNKRIVLQLNEMARLLADNGTLLKQAELDIAEDALPIIKDTTPVISGSWRQSWFIFNRQPHTSIRVSTLTRNVQSDEDPHQYAPKVHKMGGHSRSGHERAVLTAFVRDYGDEVLLRGADNLITSLRVFQ